MSNTFKDKLESELREVAASPFKANEAVDHATTAILTAIDEALPEKKSIDTSGMPEDSILGYNLAIDVIRKALGITQEEKK